MHATGASSLPAVPLPTALRKEKENSKTYNGSDKGANDALKLEYPRGWKLWLVYVATLLTMFLVGFAAFLRSWRRQLSAKDVPNRCH